MKQELQKQIDQFKDQLRALSDKVNGLPEQDYIKGTWYKSENGGMANYQSPGKHFGFTTAETWIGDNTWFEHKSNNFSPDLPATPSEVQEALTKEAVKRGFKEGVMFRCLEQGKVRPYKPYYRKDFGKGDSVLTLRYFEKDDHLYCNDGLWNKDEYSSFCSNPSIYRKGQWAEIVKDQPITICGKEVEFKDGCVEINGFAYTNDFLAQLRYYMNRGQIKSLNVGCNGQEKVDLQLIEQLINRINKG